MEKLVLVDLFDNEIGYSEKETVHKKGLLHRAFSVFVVSKNKMLIQRRNKNKYHSGGLWTNACCSHPRENETLSDAVERRLREELGIKSMEAAESFHFIYYYPFENGLCEYEYDHVFIMEYDGSEISPEPSETDSVQWITFDALAQELVESPEKFTAWFLIAAPKILEILKGKK